MHPPVVAGFHALKISRQEETTSKPFLPAGVFMPDICQQPVPHFLKEKPGDIALYLIIEPPNITQRYCRGGY